MLSEEAPYPLRGHHGLCLCYFNGVGYSGEFSENMAEIKRLLEKNPLVRITAQADSICRCCPHLAGGQCASAEKVKEYDRQVLLRCRVSEGQIMPFWDFEKLIQRYILQPGKRTEICRDCEWSALCGEK